MIESSTVSLFLSYSRADGEFLSRLAKALEAAGYRANYDRAEPEQEDVDLGISAEDEWWKRIEDMIVAADVMILVVSPHSAASAVVDKEIAFARGEGKRIIPILCRPVDFASASPRLAALNLKISFVDRSPDAFAASLRQLGEALDLDIDWLRLGSALARKAREWRTANKNHDRLLYGDAIAEAERWSMRRPGRAPAIADGIAEFIGTSRTWEQERSAQEDAQRTRHHRMRRWIRRLLAAAVVLATVGTGVVVERQRRLAYSESVMFAGVAEELLARGDHVRAMRFGALGSAHGLLQPGSTDSDSAFRRAVMSPMLERELATRASVTRIWTDSQGRFAAVVDGGGYGLSLWRIDTEVMIASEEKLAHVDLVATSDARRILFWGVDLNLPSAFATNSEVDRARIGELWTLDASGNVVESRRQRYPIAGGLWLTANGPVVTWGGGRVTVWSADFTKRLAETKPVSSFDFVRALGDGRRIITVLPGGGLEVWAVDQTARGLAIVRVARGSARSTVREIIPAPAENLILAVTESDELIALETETLTPRYRGIAQSCCLGPPEMRELTFPSGGDKHWVLLTFADAGAQAIRVATGERVGPKMAHSGVRGARFNPTGERVITYGFDNLANVWNFASGTKRAELNERDDRGSARLVGPPEGIRGAAFLPEGDVVIAWNGDGTIRVHDANTGEQLGGHMRHDDAIHGVTLLPDRRVLTAAAGPVRIWRLPNYGAPLTTLGGLCASEWYRQLSFVQLKRKQAGGGALSSTELQDGRALLTPPLKIDSEDVRLAPILSRRESGEICPPR